MSDIAHQNVQFLRHRDFLHNLSHLYHLAETEGGSVYVTMKQTAIAHPRKRDGVPKVCLVRAKYKKRKIRTIIDKGEDIQFFREFSTVIRANIDNLERSSTNSVHKGDRKARKRTK
ncbi:hypothetical protein PCE1_003123 [Barthelona sp. PCE]